jgi:queuine/archaeosine tRNA-ribosyltransferase
VSPGTAFLGYSFRRGNPEPWKSFSVRHLMVNAYDFSRKFGTSVCDTSNAKELLGYDGYLLCDSGGYQVLQGSTNVDLASIIEIQKALAADLSAMLDNARDYRAHFRGLRSYLKEFGTDFLPVIPLDASDRQVRKFAAICEDYDIDAVGVGNFVPLVRAPAHYTRLEGAFRRIGELRGMLPMKHVHLFGVGGMGTGLIALLFADSIDTTSWVHDARFWKLRLPGGGVFRARSTTSNRRKLPETYWCHCPSCARHGLPAVEADGAEGFRARATHNAWVMLREYELAAVARRENRLRPFIERRIRRNGPHHHLYRKVARFVRNDVK